MSVRLQAGLLPAELPACSLGPQMTCNGHETGFAGVTVRFGVRDIICLFSRLQALWWPSQP